MGPPPSGGFSMSLPLAGGKMQGRPHEKNDAVAGAGKAVLHLPPQAGMVEREIEDERVGGQSGRFQMAMVFCQSGTADHQHSVIAGQEVVVLLVGIDEHGKNSSYRDDRGSFFAE